VEREDFNKWAEKNNWILIREAYNPTGRQDTFLTPAGNITIIIFNLKGNLVGVAQPVPAPNRINPISSIKRSN